jgi:hypothetical protein
MRGAGFQKFLNTSTATTMTAVFAVGAAVATALAIWRNHWIDAMVYAVIALFFAVWFTVRVHGPHGGPPGHAG